MTLPACRVRRHSATNRGVDGGGDGESDAGDGVWLKRRPANGGPHPASLLASVVTDHTELRRRIGRRLAAAARRGRPAEDAAPAPAREAPVTAPSTILLRPMRAATSSAAQQGREAGGWPCQSGPVARQALIAGAAPHCRLAKLRGHGNRIPAEAGPARCSRLVARRGEKVAAVIRRQTRRLEAAAAV